MKDNTIYAGDNGRLICSKCAGYSARTSGVDISGAPVIEMTGADHQAWADAGMGQMTCETGCTAA